MIINKSGIAIRMEISGLRVMGRATQGVKLINLKGDKGAKKIISENQKDVQYIELPGDVSLVDLDTREQWDAWKKNL